MFKVGDEVTMFEVGDNVTWSSQAKGSTTQKTGIVAAIVQPGINLHKGVS